MLIVLDYELLLQKIRIYDTRDRGKAQITVEAHSADVNVLSWNTLTSFMLASGGDDHNMRVWDLRALESYVANFGYHSKAVTSVEWCPNESSMLATTSEVHHPCPPFHTSSSHVSSLNHRSH
jgi:ribosome assembly protein RRB1